MFLSDAQWLLLQPLFSHTSRGRPPSNARLVLENILWKLVNNRPWYDIPSPSPSWQTCYHQYHRWKINGIWKSITAILMQDLQERGGLSLLHAIETHEITASRGSSGQLHTSCSHHLKDTWQFSTATLLLVMLTSEL